MKEKNNLMNYYEKFRVCVRRERESWCGGKGGLAIVEGGRRQGQLVF